VIGEAHPRLGGERFVKGAARFVDDVSVPGMLHAAVLRSPHAHARLLSIDTKRARDVLGVHAVLTAADVPASAIIPNRVPAPRGTERYLQPAIARDVVRFVGEPVALPATTNPLGLRGLGECGNPGLGAATANAVCDALAPREASITALPLTAARVFESGRSHRDGRSL
jgi:CO/xanthine dehydrogenase Mo-binding subunit